MPICDLHSLPLLACYRDLVMEFSLLSKHVKLKSILHLCAWGQHLPGLRSYGVVLWEIITGERPDKLRGLRAPECARLPSPASLRTCPNPAVAHCPVSGTAR